MRTLVRRNEICELLFSTHLHLPTPHSINGIHREPSLQYRQRSVFRRLSHTTSGSFTVKTETPPDATLFSAQVSMSELLSSYLGLPTQPGHLLLGRPASVVAPVAAGRPDPCLCGHSAPRGACARPPTRPSPDEGEEGVDVPGEHGDHVGDDEGGGRPGHQQEGDEGHATQEAQHRAAGRALGPAGRAARAAGAGAAHVPARGAAARARCRGRRDRSSATAGRPGPAGRRGVGSAAGGRAAARWRGGGRRPPGLVAKPVKSPSGGPPARRRVATS